MATIGKWLESTTRGTAKHIARAVHHGHKHASQKMNLRLDLEKIGSSGAFKTIAAVTTAALEQARNAGGVIAKPLQGLGGKSDAVASSDSSSGEAARARYLRHPTSDDEQHQPTKTPAALAMENLRGVHSRHAHIQHLLVVRVIRAEGLPAPGSRDNNPFVEVRVSGFPAADVQRTSACHAASRPAWDQQLEFDVTALVEEVNQLRIDSGSESVTHFDPRGFLVLHCAVKSLDSATSSSLLGMAHLPVAMTQIAMLPQTEKSERPEWVVLSRQASSEDKQAHRSRPGSQRQTPGVAHLASGRLQLSLGYRKVVRHTPRKAVGRPRSVAESIRNNPDELRETSAYVFSLVVTVTRARELSGKVAGIRTMCALEVGTHSVETRPAKKSRGNCPEYNSVFKFGGLFATDTLTVLLRDAAHSGSAGMAKGEVLLWKPFRCATPAAENSSLLRHGEWVELTDPGGRYAGSVHLVFEFKADHAAAEESRLVGDDAVSVCSPGSAPGRGGNRRTIRDSKRARALVGKDADEEPEEDYAPAVVLQQGYQLASLRSGTDVVGSDADGHVLRLFNVKVSHTKALEPYIVISVARGRGTGVAENVRGRRKAAPVETAPTRSGVWSELGLVFEGAAPHDILCIDVMEHFAFLTDKSVGSLCIPIAELRRGSWFTLLRHRSTVSVARNEFSKRLRSRMRKHRVPRIKLTFQRQAPAIARAVPARKKISGALHAAQQRNVDWMQAFQMYDVDGTGRIERDDFLRACLSLGTSLTKQDVSDLCTATGVAWSRKATVPYLEVCLPLATLPPQRHVSPSTMDAVAQSDARVERALTLITRGMMWRFDRASAEWALDPDRLQRLGRGLAAEARKHPHGRVLRPQFRQLCEKLGIELPRRDRTRRSCSTNRNEVTILAARYACGPGPKRPGSSTGEGAYIDLRRLGSAVASRASLVAAALRRLRRAIVSCDAVGPSTSAGGVPTPHRTVADVFAARDCTTPYGDGGRVSRWHFREICADVLQVRFPPPPASGVVSYRNAAREQGYGDSEEARPGHERIAAPRDEGHAYEYTTSSSSSKNIERASASLRLLMDHLADRAPDPDGDSDTDDEGAHRRGPWTARGLRHSHRSSNDDDELPGHCRIRIAPLLRWCFGGRLSGGGAERVEHDLRDADSGIAGMPRASRMGYLLGFDSLLEKRAQRGEWRQTRMESGGTISSAEDAYDGRGSNTVAGIETPPEPCPPRTSSTGSQRELRERFTHPVLASDSLLSQRQLMGWYGVASRDDADAFREVYLSVLRSNTRKRVLCWK